MNFRQVLCSASLLLPGSLIFAQSVCRYDMATASGQVLDGTGAAVLDATITLSPGAAIAHTDRDGRFLTPCLPFGVYVATIESPSFEAVTQSLKVNTASRAIVVRLKPHTVETEVDAVIPDSGVASEEIAGSRTLRSGDVAQLADDPA